MTPITDAITDIAAVVAGPDGRCRKSHGHNRTNCGEPPDHFAQTNQAGWAPITREQPTEDSTKSDSQDRQDKRRFAVSVRNL